MSEKQLADILISSGVVTEDQRGKALKLAVSAKCSIEEALVKLGFATEESVAIGVSKLLGIPYASKENKILKPEKSQGLDKLINEQYSRENQVLPLFQEERMLAVAMASPSNMMMMENLKLMTGFEITPFVATKTQILKAIDDFYGQGSLIEKTMDRQAADDEAAGAKGEIEEVNTNDERVNLDTEMASAQGAQVVSVVNAILKQAVTERCSDIHLESYDESVALRFRIDGVLYERMAPTKKSINAVVSRIKIMSKLDIAEKRLPQDGTFSIRIQNRNVDLRVSICPTVYGEKVVMRLLDKGATQLDIDKIGFEPRQKEDFLKAARMPHGLIFLTGPTGSGKTTTLYSVLSTIKTPELNFMTIEDPVEIKLEGLNQVQVRATIGLTFAAALRSFLRQDPDVILVGEVRDQETAQTCLRAALTGHLVLSTLHTNDAMSTVVRLIDLGIEPFLLSGSLALAAAQRLVRLLCPACKKPYVPKPEQLDRAYSEAQLEKPADTSKVIFYEPKGCDKCARTGYAGRRAIYEVYLLNREMREVIYKYGGDLQRLREIAAKAGMWNLRASGWRKVLMGQTTAEEILSVTMDE